MDYRCPDCGGSMRTIAQLTSPPIYQAICHDCKATFQKEPVRDDLTALPRDYRKLDKDRAP